MDASSPAGEGKGSSDVELLRQYESALGERLVLLERNVFDLETKYFSLNPEFNVVHGFEGYAEGRPAHERARKSGAEARIFSSSSSTAKSNVEEMRNILEGLDDVDDFYYAEHAASHEQERQFAIAAMAARSSVGTLRAGPEVEKEEAQAAAEAAYPFETSACAAARATAPPEDTDSAEDAAASAATGGRRTGRRGRRG